MTASPRALFVAIVVPLIALYSITATWVPPYHGDAMTNVVTAWYLGNTGSVIATEHEAVAVPEHRGNFVWIVDSPRGPVSQYPPGAALVGTPLYALFGGEMEPSQQVGSNRPDLPPVSFPLPPVWPGTLTAVLTTALAMGFLGLAGASIAGAGTALRFALLAGLGTSAWSVASDMFWQHGPAMMWIALALFLVSREHMGWAGAAFGMAILTRPHTAVIAAAVGLGVSWSQKRLAPALHLGVGSAGGLGLLLAYNYWLLGTLTVSGAYGSDFVNNLTGSGIDWYVQNLFGALFDLRRGLVMWTPVLLVLIVGIPAAVRNAPPWVNWSALGGVLYLLVQYRANRFSGGEGHFTYRYPLEALAALALLLLVAFEVRVRQRPLLLRMFTAAALVSVAMHATGAFLWPAILIE